MNNTFRSVAVKLITLIESIHEALVNHPFVVAQSTAVVRHSFEMVRVLGKVTERTVRLYCPEGKHLSINKGMKTRMTWYTNPETALLLSMYTLPEESLGRKVVREYIVGLTGRLVYVDLVVSIMSPYSHRFYKRGDEAFILQDELINRAKRNWKYVKSNVAEIATDKE